jgi:hypothetical protein
MNNVRRKNATILNEVDKSGDSALVDVSLTPELDSEISYLTPKSARNVVQVIRTAAMVQRLN